MSPRCNWLGCTKAAGILLLGFGAVPASAQGRGPDPKAAAALEEAAQKPTPRTADGHPDLNGSWAAPNFTPQSFYKDDDGKTTYLFGKEGGNPKAQGRGGRGRGAAPNGPSYKPEFEAKVAALAAGAETKDWKDPALECRSLGVPRIGPPKEILQSPKMIAFFYQTDAGSGTVPGIEVRLISTDGRPHRTDVDPSYLGDSIGHWEGDTLVVDANHFTTDTWLGGAGYFHSKALHVVERITRKGDTIRYEVTVEDPAVLTQPWTPALRTLMISDNVVTENPPCNEHDLQHMDSQTQTPNP